MYETQICGVAGLLSSHSFREVTAPRRIRRALLDRISFEPVANDQHMFVTGEAGDELASRVLAEAKLSSYHGDIAVVRIRLGASVERLSPLAEVWERMGMP
jgi:hypothetical protein